MKAKMSENYNKSALTLPPLALGDMVRLKTPNKPWGKGVVTCEIDSRSYEVQTESGGNYRRNRRHLHKSHEAGFHREQPEFNILTPSVDSASTVPTKEGVPNIDSDQIPNASTSTISDSHNHVTRSGREVKPPMRLQDYEH